MKNLSKEKKQHVVLVVMGTLIVLSGVWFGLISWEMDKLARLESEREAIQTKLDGMKGMIEQADTLVQQAETEQARLAAAETQMASGDHYAWIINTIRGFKANHPRVDIPQYSTILVEDTKILPKFPYQQAKLSVSGTAYYHDLGKFIADFENEFPYIRLQNLDVQSGSSLTGSDNEKLSFRMDVVTLIKPEV